MWTFRAQTSYITADILKSCNEWKEWIGKSCTTRVPSMELAAVFVSDYCNVQCKYWDIVFSSIERSSRVRGCAACKNVNKPQTLSQGLLLNCDDRLSQEEFFANKCKRLIRPRQQWRLIDRCHVMWWRRHCCKQTLAKERTIRFWNGSDEFWRRGIFIDIIPRVCVFV